MAEAIGSLPDTAPAGIVAHSSEPPSPARRAVARAASYTESRRRLAAPSVFALATIAALLAGWNYRDEGHLTPEQGLGYWLGIAGGSAMLLLLLYPLRKRWSVLRPIGSTVFWFRLHMILGIAGPVMILFHANFKLGSTNSNVALFAMLTVALSGIIGRYFYGKIHLGLYGRKAQVQQILDDADALKDVLGVGLPLSERITKVLNSFSSEVLAPAESAFASGIRWLTLGRRARRCHRQVLAAARELLELEGRRQGWSWRVRRQHLSRVHVLLAQYFAAIRKAAAFSHFERLFALWHVLHLPLFFLLIFTAVLHVVAVHTF